MRFDRGERLLMAFRRHRPFSAAVHIFFFAFGTLAVVDDLLGLELKPPFMKYVFASSFTMPTLVGWMRGTLRKGRAARPNAAIVSADPEPRAESSARP